MDSNLFKTIRFQSFRFYFIRKIPIYSKKAIQNAFCRKLAYQQKLAGHEQKQQNLIFCVQEIDETLKLAVAPKLLLLWRSPLTAMFCILLLGYHPALPASPAGSPSLMSRLTISVGPAKPPSPER